MNIIDFINEIKDIGIEFFTGVPDSQLKGLCDYLMQEEGVSKKHVIAHNEGACMSLAAGYHMATGKIPCVYMQNSGIGNAINPLASLMHEKVYALPVLMVIGWRGEPGVKDEPQHVFQGQVTEQLLECMQVKYFILEKTMSIQTFKEKMQILHSALEAGKQCAIIVKKDSLESTTKQTYKNTYTMKREAILEDIVDVIGEDIIVSTTGKTSRELFEIREKRQQTHVHDFLTVGSMGHASMIALSIAQATDKRVWCVDGDGALLMHMGAMALIGSSQVKNYIHVVLNNEAHETVGGMPTVAKKIDFTKIATSCGYDVVECVEDKETLQSFLGKCHTLQGKVFLEVRTAIGSREDLGRPTTTPQQNKEQFMRFLMS